METGDAVREAKGTSRSPVPLTQAPNGPANGQFRSQDSLKNKDNKDKEG